MTIEKSVTICPSGGFCFGVKRAVEIAETTAKTNKNKQCRTLGPIVHNKKVSERLEREGVKIVIEPEEMSSGILIIRSHGASPDVIARAKKQGLEIVDATCPFVKRIHGIAVKLSEEGIPVIIVGKYDHPEVQGILGYASGERYVVNSDSDIMNLKGLKKAGVVAQTTKTKEDFLRIAGYLLDAIPECHVYNTICSETLKRQKDAAALASVSDVIIAVGGRHSSNTSRLFEIVKKFCPKSYFIEELDELKKDWFENSKKVGIVYGASTPLEDVLEIKSVVEDILEISRIPLI